MKERLSRGVTTAAHARRCAERIRQRLDDETFEDLRLLVSELVTNGVRHSDAAEDSEIILVIDVRNRTIRIEVTDEGSGFARPDGISRPDDEDPAGRGLYLVEALADRWGVHRSEGTTVWAELKLQS